MNIHKRIKISLIVVSCVLLDVCLHMLTTPYGTMPDNPDLSFIAEVIGIEATATLWAFSAFSVAAFVFLRIRKRIPGESVKKGLRYGASVALLWLSGMLEGVSLLGNPIINEIVVGLSDAIPVFLLGVLLGFVKPDTIPATYSTSRLPVRKHKAIFYFAAIFLSGRFFAYTTGVIKSGIQGRP